MIRQRTLKEHRSRHWRWAAYRPEGLPEPCGRRADTGVVFRRVDLQQPVDIPATASRVGDTRLSSCLERDGVKVATVEHLMSAFAGLGIDNVYVDLTAAEVPIMDGSAGPFIFLIQSAGIEEQNAAKKFIRLLEAGRGQEGDKWARFEPLRRVPHGLQRRVQPSRSFSSPASASSSTLPPPLT